MLRLRTFGGLSVEDGGERLTGLAAQRSRLALLTLLARAGERGISRDKVLAYLWSDSDEAHARNALNQALFVIRRELHEDAIVAGATDVHLNPQVITHDAGEFETALERGDPERAISLYAGPFLDGFHVKGAPEFERWAEGERTQLAAQYASALERLAADAQGRGNLHAAVEWRRRLASLDPLDSRYALGLMEVLAASGDRPAALKHAQVHAAVVKAELDAPPDPAIGRLAQLLKRVPAESAAAGHRAELSLPQTEARSVAARAIAPATGWWRQTLAVVAVLLLAALALWELRGHAPGASAPGAKAVAVLPFTNLSPDSGKSYFAAGITDDIALQLSKVAALHVIGPAAVLRFQREHNGLRNMADSLGLAGALSGSIRWDGNRVRIVARLENPRTGEQLWGEGYDRTTQDIFAIQSDIAQKIATALQAQLTPGEQGRIQERPTENIEAYGYALRAEDLLKAVPTNANIALAMDLLKKAVRVDAGFGRAYRDLADLYYWRANRTLVKQPLLDSARAFASKALSSDIDADERAHVYRVMAITYADQRLFRQSLAFNLKAVAVKPDYFWGVVGVAELSFQTGDFPQSLAYAKKAQALQPGNQLSHFFIARAYLALDDFARARYWASKTVELYPDDPEARLISVDVHSAAGEFSLAAADIEDVLKRHAKQPQSSGPDEGLIGILQYGLENAIDVGDYVKARDYHGRLKVAIAAIAGESEPDWWFDHPEFVCKTANTNWGYVLQKTGHTEEAETTFILSRNWDQEQLREGSEDSCNAYDLAAMDAAQGQGAAAYRQLQRAIDAGWRHYRFAMEDPLLERLHGQPQFQRMMSAVRSKVDEMRALVAEEAEALRRVAPGATVVASFHPQTPLLAVARVAAGRATATAKK